MRTVRKTWFVAPAIFLATGAATPAPPSVTVRLGTEIVTLPLERYVAAVLAGESGAFRSDAALEAMAVAARTYAVRMRGRHASEGYDFCSTTHCQRAELRAITPRLESAAANTAGELLWFEGKPAFTPYTQDCGGRTEDAAAIWPDLAAPYLSSHPDPYCVRAGTTKWQWAGDPAEISRALMVTGLQAPSGISAITIVTRTASGRAAELSLAGQGGASRMSASSFRFAMGRSLGWNTIRSDQYDIGNSGGRIVFQGRGAGHGAGLCQRGADQMGVEGRSYGDILAAYYPGATVGTTARGLNWQRLSGDGITLRTTQPDRDSSVLGVAVREARAVKDRTGWALPPALEIRIYPDVESFRNSTGEPGWVSAVTEGSRIRLQPAAVLRSRHALESTLRHELFHAAVEARASANLPVWFREGVVEYLAGAAETGSAAPPSNADLSEKSDAERARRAYQDAARAVRALVKTYGETAVLGWIARGLPPEVKNTSASQAATKSR